MYIKNCKIDNINDHFKKPIYQVCYTLHGKSIMYTVPIALPNMIYLYTTHTCRHILAN